MLFLLYMYLNGFSENNRYFWKCMLQHTKCQVKLYEVHRFLMFITAMCVIFPNEFICFMGLNWGIMLLISSLLIPSISLLFSVVWHGVYGTTHQVKCNSKDQKARSIPRDRRHLRTACLEVLTYIDVFARETSNLVQQCSVDSRLAPSTSIS